MSRFKKALHQDIFELPGLRSIKRWRIDHSREGKRLKAWRGLIAANSTVRREAKALMFAKLAEAARQGTPLDIALELSSISQQEILTGGKDKKRSRFSALASVLVGIAALFASYIMVLVFSMTAFRYADVPRAARMLALRLRAHLLAGPIEKSFSGFQPTGITARLANHQNFKF